MSPPNDEHLRFNPLPNSGGNLTPEQIQRIANAIAGNNKIEAIKLYRSFSGNDLRDSKEFIEKLAVQLNAQDPERYPVMPAGKGCLGLLLAGLGLVVLELLRAC